MDTPVQLTSFSRGAGCGCKIAPAVLDQMLRTNSGFAAFPSLLVGNQSKDDAAVYETENGQCIISTTDFFMPIVDDAYDFGRIASANAISDIYAMGGKPLMAVAILGWPVDKLSPELAAQVMEGSRHICAQAGIPMAGGHSIDSPEPFFGLAVTGVAHTSRIRRNSTAREGDVLLLTKPIGVGILSTAHKRGAVSAEDYQDMIASMTALNDVGQALAAEPGVHAMTDVTGFGLLGHLVEMCEGSGLSARLDYAAVPVIPSVRQYVQQNMIPDATYRNWNAYQAKVGFEPGVPVMEAFKLLPDPQTNGGLLIAVDPERLNAVGEILRTAGLGGHTMPVGRFESNKEKMLTVC